MSARQPVTLRYQMDQFAAEGGERHQNRDGWGIMFSQGHDAHLFREPAPASDSELDRYVRRHEVPSCDVIAHVRRASSGNRTLANTHPFRRARHGYAHHFAHNGTLHALEADSDAQALQGERLGETDSELAFLVLLERLDRTAPDVENAARRFAVFSRFASDMKALGSANFLFFDGYCLYVHADQRVWETADGLTEPKSPGLHIWASSPDFEGTHHQCAAGELRNLPKQIILFASVPLNDTGWTPLPRGTCLAVRRGEILSRQNIA